MKILLTIIMMTFMVSCHADSRTTTNLGSQSRMNWREARKAFDVEYSFLGKEAYFTQVNQLGLNSVQPPPIIKYSLERENLIKRLERWNNPNKISYIYLMSNAGQIVGYFTIKGKVSSVNSKLTTTTQISYMYSQSVAAVESPDMDGSYGSNGDAVFFYLTDGTYMEWNGKYFLSDRPVKLSVQPIMTYDVTPKKGK